jgi:hypothetical protein
VGDATVRVTVYSPGGTFSAASLLGLRKAAAGDDVVSMGVTGDAFDRFVIDADGGLRWGSGAGATDVLLHWIAANVLKLEDVLEIPELAAPAAPGANNARVFAQDNGAGKTQVAVRFPTGTAVVLATEA